MFEELGISAIFPSVDSVSRQPLPSTGSLGTVPPLHRLLRAARTPGHPSRALRFLRACATAPVGAETTRPPRFLGSPSRTCPVLRPRWDRRARPSGSRPTLAARRCCLPQIRRRRLPRHSSFGAQSRGLYPRCLRFAAAVADGPRKTRSRLVVLLGRTGFEPAGSLREVSALSSTWHPPHPGFPWRTESSALIEVSLASCISPLKAKRSSSGSHEVGARGRRLKTREAVENCRADDGGSRQWHRRLFAGRP